MTNLEYYKDEIKNYIENGYDFQDTLCEIYCNKNQHDASDLDVLNWLCEEYKEPILDEEEKKYLSAVIKPFRKEETTIMKRKEYSGCEFVRIAIEWKEGSIDYIEFPSFEKGTMYKGMELNKEYTLEELGL